VSTTPPSSMTEEQLLAELQPLAAVITDKLQTVPVRLGPGGTDDLARELVFAIALHVARDVLPADALELAHPPRAVSRKWIVESRTNSEGTWRAYGGPYRDGERAEALEDFERSVELSGRWRREFRLVRETTTHAVEAEHIPEPRS